MLEISVPRANTGGSLKTDKTILFLYLSDGLGKVKGKKQGERGYGDTVEYLFT